MARHPARLPLPLSQRLSGTSSELLQRRGKEVDVAVAGIPFRLATSQELPMSVETIPLRKEQVDTEPEPGEQSIDASWWRRAQDSFHQGAGNLYQESRLDGDANQGFLDSDGVNVWTKGEVTLLRKMNRIDAQTNFSRLSTFSVSGTRTNLCTNPNIETNTTGFVAQADPQVPGSAPLLSRDTTVKYSGAASLKVTWQGDDGTGFPPVVWLPLGATVAGTTYTISAKVFVPSGSPGVVPVAGNAFGTGSGSVKDEWVTIRQTWTAAGTSDTVSIWPSSVATAGTSFYLDEILIEEAPSAQPYFDGNSPGGAWTGATNLSVSTLTITAATDSVCAVSEASLWTADDADSAFVALHTPAGKTLRDGFVSGLYFYDVASDGTLYQGLLSSPGTASNWPLTGGGTTRIMFGKHRLWGIGGRRIWQPDLTDPSGTAQAAVFTHPNQGWQYTCMAEGPQAMYFGGHDGRTSSIQAITLDSGGGVPTLTGAATTAILPDGELVQEIAILAGQFIGIGTNRGFRVGVVDDIGLTYGPLLITPEGIRACTSVTTLDSFFLVTFRTDAGASVVYKVNTAEQIADGIFPYAKDAKLLDVGYITSVATFGRDVPRILALDQDGAFWSQDAAELVETGWLQTGRVRYRTYERKLFKYVELDTAPLHGTIVLTGITEDESEFDIATWFSAEGAAGTDPIGITSAVGPQRHISLRFTLARDADDATVGPLMRSYLLRAMPAAKVQRMITLPLLCFDREQGHSGMRYGYDGYAADRLAALQLIEDGGDTVLYQNFGLLDGSGEVVVIDNMRFVQTAPGSTREGASSRGGILILQLRTASA